MSEYSSDFYQYQMQGSLRSAEVIVPMVVDIVKPESVIDIGCGVGTWLSVYRAQGIADLQGVDGDYVDRNLLLIDAADFRAQDLTEPLGANRTYDLVQSLEVAEHIPENHARRFIADLTRLGGTILFSAAVPYQLGTGHVNEQHAGYWIDLFAEHGYAPVDAIRPAVWDNEAVEVCYRQNILLFATQETIAANRQLAEAHAGTRHGQLSIIHPGLYEPRIQRLLNGLLDVATTVLSNGNLPLARSVLQSIVDFDPRNDRAWNTFGQLAAQSNNSAIAISHFKKAIELNPSNASHHFNLGVLYANIGATDESLQHLRLAQAASPDDPKIRSAIETLAGNNG